MKAVVFGSGLSGIFAAWACHESGVDYVVYTDKVVKPTVQGFMYLHKPCGLPLSSELLKQHVVPMAGDPNKASEFYSNRVYGNPSIPNSLKYAFDNPEVQIWNMHAAIEHIWGHIGDRVKPRVIKNLAEVVSITSHEADLGFSTIPLPVLDKDGIYNSVEAYVTVSPDPSAMYNAVYYNGGVEDEPAYRWGVINGQRFTESRVKPGRVVHKVTFAKYAPRVPDNLKLVGRYGAWDKTHLAHVVYDKVKRALEEWA